MSFNNSFKKSCQSYSCRQDKMLQVTTFYNFIIYLFFVSKLQKTYYNNNISNIILFHFNYYYESGHRQ